MSKKVNKVDASVNESNTEVSVKKETPKVQSDPIVLTKYSSDEKGYSEVVEEHRKVVAKQSKTSQTLSTVSIALVFALCAGGFFLMGSNQIVSYILLGSAILVLITMSIIIKKISNPDIKGYINTASTAVNRFIFNDEKFSECVYEPASKIDFSEIYLDGVYKDIKECVSRDVVKGNYNNHSFKVAELGIYKQQVKRTKPTAFVGKYLVYPNSLHLVDRIVIVSRGQTDIDVPDGIDDLTKLFEDAKLAIYGAKELNIKDVISDDFINAIKDIKIEKHLLTQVIAIWAGKTVVYSSYDDESITLPFNKVIDESCYEQYRDDLTQTMDALNMLIKE